VIVLILGCTVPFNPLTDFSTNQQQFLVKFCKLSIFSLHITALTLQNDVTWCYEKKLQYIFINISKTCSTKLLIWHITVNCHPPF